MAGALWLGQFTFYLLMGFILVTAQIEYDQLTEKLAVKPQKIPSIIFGVLIFTLTVFHARQMIDTKWIIAPVLTIIILVLIEFIKKSSTPFQNVVYTIFGIVYIAVPLSCSNYLVFSELSGYQYNFQILLFVFVLIWSYDTFAYITGKFAGKNKLLKNISPKKTWEGAIGGVLMSIFIAGLLHYTTGIFALHQWIIISIIVSITGTLGDLTESALKRSVRMKDSGRLLPGHGGILDRFDAALFAIPSVLLYLKLFVI